MAKNISNYQSDKEIELIDFIVVVIKRKWLIVGLVLIALSLSVLYITLITETNFKAHIIIKPPQEYTTYQYRSSRW